MKPCPHCRQAPQWHYCRNVSRKEGGDHYLIEGCRHAEAFAKPFAFIAAAERDSFAAKWDAEAERLFAEYTTSRPWDDEQRAQWLKRHPGEPLPAIAEGWTDPQRVSFRTRLFEEPVAEEMALVSPEQIAATKAVVAAHRSDGPDDDNF